MQKLAEVTNAKGQTITVWLDRRAYDVEVVQDGKVVRRIHCTRRQSALDWLASLS